MVVGSCSQYQSLEQKWFYERSIRVTCSLIESVCKSRKQKSLVNIANIKLQEYFDQKQSGIKSIHLENSLQQEEIGRKRIQEKYYCTIQKTGFKIHDLYHYFGGSPDGKTQIDGQEYLIEIKWVSKIENRNKNINFIVNNQKQFYLIQDADTEEFVLSKSHNYYYKIQVNMSSYGIQKTIFGVFTEIDSHYQIISYDDQFFKSIKPEIQDFYFLVFLPLYLNSNLKQELSILKNQSNQKTIDRCYFKLQQLKLS